MLAPGCVALYSFTNAARAPSYQTTSGGADDFADATVPPSAVAPPTATAATTASAARAFSERPRQGLRLISEFMWLPSLLLSVKRIDARSQLLLAARLSCTNSGSAIPGAVGARTIPSAPTLGSRTTGFDVTSDS